jgi:hypothetical protein
MQQLDASAFQAKTSWECSFSTKIKLGPEAGGGLAHVTQLREAQVSMNGRQQSSLLGVWDVAAEQKLSV